ncbi:ribonuclease J [Carboxydochorda subterranea]|uniref:Ribonuclease J n=1 Tax=Carboxydichorda subterranea TaxID=3109565 RepID=A0ABZ1C0L0_9FIRM|nr:ribonuclease J [Limnochorda sp. L945t]WRP18360.1 ribonuclease J [Limnochorda sp. L945t]
MGSSEPALSVIPLGGLGEVGKNMMVLESADDILVIDAGVMFPEEEMLGIDLVIPDFSYLVERRQKIRAIVLTHGHEDHIGALPYVLRQIQAPVYGTRLTLGLVRARLLEHNLESLPEFIEVQAGQRRRLGGFDVEFIHLNHSIADAVAIAVHGAVGTVLHVTDFKFDQTPIDGRPTDYHRLAELGKQGVHLLLSDSTNAEQPGWSPSERRVGEAFLEAFRRAAGRVLVATFATNVHRIQQAIDAAVATGRRVAVVGRSMETVVGIAAELGYLRIPEGVLIAQDQIGQQAHNRLVILTTGSQGEPMSALSRMASQDHRLVEIVPGDTVIISAHPIPGNERLVGRTVNRLFKLGANVIYEPFEGIHASGHACQEELKLLLNLVRPRFFVPVHGEYRMLVKHARLARDVGIAPDGIFIVENGDVLELTADRLARKGRVQAGQVFVDGLSVGDVGNVVLRDRRHLAQDGILVVVLTVDSRSGELLAGPELVSRGFVYVRESETFMEEARQEAKTALLDVLSKNGAEWGAVKGRVREALGQFIFERLKRRPMILPIIVEV